ncbi:MAG: hypothetical protein C0404_05420 [Verrucomicrobia bacterium]|nr:hypothetical protein [Verrucomicrobiota bacterium]
MDAAFEDIVKQYQRMVYQYALSLAGNHFLAEDITQDTFVIAWRRLQSEQDVENMGAWLRAIAKRKVWEEFRRLNRHPLCLAEDVAIRIEDILVAAEAGYDNDRMSHALAGCFDKLNESMRRIFSMRYEQRLSAIDIGQTVGRSQGSVNMILSRLRIRLRECMAHELEGA